MSSNGYDSRLTLARQAANELAQMKRQAEALPELERAEAARLRRQSAQQQGEAAEADLGPAAKEYRLSLEKSNLEVIELIKVVTDIVSRRRLIDAQGERVRRLAEKVAVARIELGIGWGHYPNENRELLQATTTQVLAEFKAKPGRIRLSEELEESELTAPIVDFLSQFCDITPAERPRTLLTGRVQIVGHDGREYWG